MTFRYGATVYDALKASGVDSTERNHLGLGLYITSIGGIAAGAAGTTRGWTYEINGVQVSAGCDKQVLKNGDVVVWKYVT